MNIEISPNDYWKLLPYEDAILYCQLLDIDGKNDWRLLTPTESLDDNLYTVVRQQQWSGTYKFKKFTNRYTLWAKMNNFFPNGLGYVVPVRDA